MVILVALIEEAQRQAEKDRQVYAGARLATQCEKRCIDSAIAALAAAKLSAIACADAAGLQEPTDG